MHPLLRTLALCIILCCGVNAFADESMESDAAKLEQLKRSWTFTFYFENDLFVNLDSNYTNGVKFSWLSPDLLSYAESRQLPKWTHQFIEYLPFIHKPGNIRNVALSLGQNMYTPKDITIPTLQVNDRPYAGWLNFGIGFHSRSARQLDVVELSLGVIGPLSFTEESQDFVHRVRDINRPKGWDHQLKNEPAINLFWERRHRIFEYGLGHGLGFDMLGGYGAAMGNVAIFAKVTGEMRAGYNLPIDFGTSTIRFGGDTSAPSSPDDPRLSRGKSRFGIYAFAGGDARGIARDIFLDGNTFRDSHSVDKEYFVGSFSCGLSAIYGSWKATYAHVRRMRQFELQENYSVYGSISISYSY
ncbi:MAG: lipid A deacylase LpxR family protein [Verrucomicrobiota bacterium]|nr:lipid A deacylase LpxR family protein [Verrucomicrobiota bacterium]